MSKKWLGLPHEPPEEKCTGCGDTFWCVDLRDGLCPPCFNKQEKYGICESCHYLLGSKCRKTKKYVGMSDWCSAYKKEEVK